MVRSLCETGGGFSAILQYIEGAIKLHQDCNATCIYQTILELSECSGILPLMFVHGIFTQVVSKISLKNFKFVFFREILQIQHHLKLMVFVSSRSVNMRGFSFLSLYKSVFIFQFLNVKMYNYGKQNIIVNYIIKKLNKTQFHQKV